MRSVQEVHLLPPLYDNLEEFTKLDRSVAFAVSPTRDALAVFATPVDLNKLERETPPRDDAQSQDIYLSCWHRPPSAERRLLITDTSLIFAALQKLIINDSEDENSLLMRTPKEIATFRKLVGDYIIHIQECWVFSSQAAARKDDPPHFPVDHYRSIYTSMSLFQTLYLPEDGIEDVPVGDELLEWLNTHFIEPSTEEGDMLSSLERPWEDDAFWPYIIQSTLRGLSKSSIFFLNMLSRHPSEDLQVISDSFVALLSAHPRQSQFSTEKEFFSASRRWRDRAKALRLELDRIPDDSRHDGYFNWWNHLSDLLGVLEGRGEILQVICSELGGDWKEVVCTWGVWIDIGLRRSELPDLVVRILVESQPDPTDSEDLLHVELFQGRIAQALSVSSDMDVWLAAHMADVMAPLGLLDSDVDGESGLSIRDQYVIAYADYLQSDPALWRLTVDYLCTCGNIGKQMSDEILIRVSLGLDKFRIPTETKKGNESDPSKPDEVDTKIEEGDVVGVVKELNATCYEYKRETARREICRIAGQTLTRHHKYGVAISYCHSAEDWSGVGYIVDRVLEEYIWNGPSRFTSLVADIAPSLQELRTAAGVHRTFVHRLMFVVRYAEFHQRVSSGEREDAALDLISLFEEDLVPRTWWGVLLNDAIDFLFPEGNLYYSPKRVSLLLQRLEEVSTRTQQGLGTDYLDILVKKLKLNSVGEALERLNVLRVVLARYFARSSFELWSS